MPTAGCIVAFPYLSGWGHVAYVTGVSNGMVYFFDYNGWGGCESYGEGSVPVNAGGAYYTVYIH
jgi:surface antigen